MVEATLTDVFSQKYRLESDWGGHSGGGSSASRNLPYRAFLEQFISLNSISTVTDIGCGDWQFSRFINFDAVHYRGFDVVPLVVEQNQARFSSDRVSFSLMPEKYEDIEGGDLLIVKDVLQHLPDKTILEFKKSILPKFKFCLITNSYEKLGDSQNRDIPAGGFRCLDLNAPPYLFDGTYMLEYRSAFWEM